MATWIKTDGSSEEVKPAGKSFSLEEMQKYVGIDEVKCMQISHDLMPYLLEQAYVITAPSPYYYNMWWPWAKNYHGEYSVGYYNFFLSSKYSWRDQALKKQLTGQ